jgi:hypothetical protein
MGTLSKIVFREKGPSDRSLEPQQRKEVPSDSFSWKAFNATLLIDLKEVELRGHDT